MRMRSTVTWRLWLLPAILSSSVSAQWHVETFIGPVKTLASEVEIQQPAQQTALVFHEVSYSSEAFKQPLYYGVRAGVLLSTPNWLGFEIEFIHSKAYARTARTVHVTGTLHGAPYAARLPMRVLLRDFSFSHGANLVLANLVFRESISQLEARLRLGFGFAVPHTESTFEGQHQEQYELTFPAMQAALGFGRRLWPHAEILVEYKFSYTSVTAVRIAHGHANTQLVAHHFVAGLGFVF